MSPSSSTDPTVLPTASSPTVELGLSALGFLELAPPELVEVAASAGFTSVSVRVRAAVAGGAEHPLIAGSPLSRATLARVRETGVDVRHVELLSLGSRETEQYRPLLEGAAAVGARRVVVTGDHPDLQLVADRLASLCGAAAELGFVVDLEFMPFRPVATLAQAVEVVTLAACDNARVLVDALHLARSGGTVADVATVPRFALGACHLCDAPVAAPPSDELATEARAGRLPPGAGGLPLAKLVAALPEGTPFVAEVPLDERYDGLSARERALLIQRATASVLARSG